MVLLQDFFSPLAAGVGLQGRDSEATLIPRASYKASGMGAGFCGFRVSGV